MNPRKPAVDYRKFRLRKLNTPEFSHLKLLLGWVGYFGAYILTERLIPPEACTPVHCALDDAIPFCELFVIPYVLWYFYVAGSLLYFALYHVEGFRKLSQYLMITQIAAMTVYVLLPSRQDLRPAVFPRENVFTWVIGGLYALDTSTNVCPSLHVAYSLGLASVWLREKSVGRVWKGAMVALSALVCLSTVFIKQHSVVDAVAALPVCLLAEWFCFWRQKMPRGILLKKMRKHKAI